MDAMLTFDVLMYLNIYYYAMFGVMNVSMWLAKYTSTVFPTPDIHIDGLVQLVLTSSELAKILIFRRLREQTESKRNYYRVVWKCARSQITGFSCCTRYSRVSCCDVMRAADEFSSPARGYRFFYFCRRLSDGGTDVRADIVGLYSLRFCRAKSGSEAGIRTRHRHGDAVGRGVSLRNTQFHALSQKARLYLIRAISFYT